MLWQLHSETSDVGEGSKVCRNTQCLFTQTQLGRERRRGRERGRGREELSESFTKV